MEIEIGGILVFKGFRGESIIGTVASDRDVTGAKKALLKRAVYLTKTGKVSNKWRIERYWGFQYRHKEISETGYWWPELLREATEVEKESYRQYLLENPEPPREQTRDYPYRKDGWVEVEPFKGMD